MGKPFLAHGPYKTNHRPHLVHRPNTSLKIWSLPTSPMFHSLPPVLHLLSNPLFLPQQISHLFMYMPYTFINLYLWFLSPTAMWARAFNAGSQEIFSCPWNQFLGPLYFIFQKSMSQWTPHTISQIFKKCKGLRFYHFTQYNKLVSHSVMDAGRRILL